MPGRFSPAMKAEVAKRQSDLCWLLDLSFAGGTKRYSEGSVASLSLGQYVGKLLDIGGLSEGGQDRDYGLSQGEMTVTLDDTDFEIAKYLESSNGLTVVGTAAVLRLASNNVIASDWFTLFTGIVDDYAFPAPLTVQLVLRTDDRKLNGTSGRLVTGADFPAAVQGARGQMIPRIYGVWDSGGEPGAVPCPLVDIANNWYLVCEGWAKAVDRVYVNGVQVTSGCTITHPLVNGRRYTMVVFTASQADAAITADVQGYEATGDGSGALISIPSDQLKHYLVNFQYNDWKDGAWFADSTAPINTTFFSSAATFLSAHGHKGSARLGGGEPIKGIDVVNGWCATFRARPWWTNLGKLGVRFEDPGIATIYVDDLWIKWGEQVDHLGYSLKADTRRLVSGVTVQYVFSAALGQYTQGLTVSDPSVTNGAPEAFDLPYAHAGV